MASLMGRNAKVVTASGTITECIDWSLNITTELISQGVMGDDGWNTVHGAGITGYEGSMSFLFDKDDTNGQVYLYDAMVAGTKLTDVHFYVDGTNYYKPDTVSNAAAGLYISSYNVTASTEDVIRLEMGYQGSGPVLLTT